MPTPIALRNATASLAIALAWLFVLPSHSAAQVSTATINGTVRDATGAVVPESDLVLQSVETGIERRSVSNSVGVYTFVSITPGIYVLSATKEGFRTSSLQPFTLAVNQTATFDFALEIGAVAETVTVEAVGAEVQSSTAELGSVMAENQVVDLPLNGRNFTQLLTLTPGASPISTAQNRGGFGSSAIGEFAYPAMNGQSNRSNFFLTDGVINHGSAVSTYATPPIIDAIQEFKVQTHNDQAEFGQGTGGIVNVVTKSGTNQLHGTLWEFMRNDNLDSRNFFRRNVVPLSQNMYGATVGGPAVRNKTFYFFAWQGFKRRTPANRLYRVPTDANLMGDHSDWPAQIYDPQSTREDAATGTFIRDPFTNNMLPQSRLDSGFVSYAQQTIPKPISTGVADRNQLDTTNSSLDQDEFNVRGDHNFSANDMVWGRVSWSDLAQTGSAGRQGLGSLVNVRTVNIGASWVHTFSPTSILQFQFGRTTINRDTGSSFTSAVDPTSFGFEPLFCCSFRSDLALMPSVNVAQFFSGGERVANTRTSDIYSYKGNFTKILGNHQLKIGAEYSTNRHFGVTNDHNVAFIPANTADPQTATGGSPLASWLLNVPNNAGRRDFFKRLHRGAIGGFYVQDNWKVTSKLTVNIGLRYDRTWSPRVGDYEDRGIFAGTPDFERVYGGLYVIQAKPDSCAALQSAPCIPTPDGSLPDEVRVSPTQRLIGDWTDNWQPRVGIAYRVSNRTAIRASGGIFYDSWAGMNQMMQAQGHTWPDVGQQQSGNLNTPTSGNPVPGVSAKNPFPAGLLPGPTPFNRVAWYADPSIKNQYSMQWNFGLQHQLASDTLISANYVGSANRRAPLDHFYNTATTPGPGDPAERSPYPFIVPTFWQRSVGRANYNAFQFQLTKRARAFTYMVNYTWSKTINLACDGWYNVEGCSTQTPYDHVRDKGVAGHDLTHIFNFNWVYRIPIGPGMKSTGSKLADYVIGNWQLNGIANLYSGRPYHINVSGDIANTRNRNGYMRADQVGDPHLSNPTPSRWFNTDAFRAPAPFTFGNSGRHALRSDGVTNFDLSLFRDFPLPGREGMKLQFRAESFNAFNHADFAIPVQNLSRSNFGVVTATQRRARQFQLGLKFIF